MKVPAVLRILCVVACAVTADAASAPSAGAQQPPPVAGPGSDLEAVVLVAGTLGVDPERVRLVLPEVVADASPADSIRVHRGASGRWTVIRWVGGRPSASLLRVGITEEVPVAARDLPRGHLLTDEDVRRREEVFWDGEAPARVDPIGFVAERRVSAGERLEPPAVRPPLLVRGGDPVEAIFETDRIRIRVRAEALASARRGGRLPVRLESGRRVEATAVDAGTVHVTPGGMR